MKMTRCTVLIAQAMLTSFGCAGTQAPAAAPAAAPIAVWIDVDTAAGVPQRDIDDAVALIQAFHSPELSVQGISVVFGNTSLDNAVPIAQEVTRRFGPTGLQVHAGASSEAQLGQTTAATRALAEALMAQPLTLLVLGPATNIATLIANRPDLIPRIERIVAVAGRRPGQRFTTGTQNLRGHRDFNFEKDAQAFQVILDSGVPLVLTPWEISSTVWITERELDLWAKGPPPAQWLAQRAPSWIALWKQTFGVQGFNPFDTLAVAALTSPQHVSCDRWSVRIIQAPNDVTAPEMQGGQPAEIKPYLVVDATEQDGARALYCHTAAPAFLQDLMQRVLTRSKRLH